MSPSTIKHGKKRTEADTAANEDEADDNGLDGADGRKKKELKEENTERRNRRKHEKAKSTRIRKGERSGKKESVGKRKP